MLFVFWAGEGYTGKGGGVATRPRQHVPRGTVPSPGAGSQDGLRVFPLVTLVAVVRVVVVVLVGKVLDHCLGKRGAGVSYILNIPQPRPHAHILTQPMFNILEFICNQWASWGGGGVYGQYGVRSRPHPQMQSSCSKEPGPTLSLPKTGTTLENPKPET